MGGSLTPPAATVAALPPRPGPCRLRARRRARRRASGLRPELRARDFDAVVVEDGAAAHVAVALGDGRVDVGAAGDALGPEALGGGGHAGAHAVAHGDGRAELAAIVVDACGVAR